MKLKSSVNKEPPKRKARTSLQRQRTRGGEGQAWRGAGGPGANTGGPLTGTSRPERNQDREQEGANLNPQGDHLKREGGSDPWCQMLAKCP